MFLSKGSYGKDLLMIKVLVVIVILTSLTCFFIFENELVLLFFAIPLFLGIVLTENVQFLNSLLVFVLPLSLTFRMDSINLSLSLPAEPLLGVLGVLTLIIYLFGNSKHKVVPNRLLLSYWFFIALSVLFSTMYLVSFKSFVVFTVYLVVFYFLNYYLFLNTDNFTKSVIKLFTIFSISLALVVLFTTYKHYDFGFNKNYSGTVVEPFFSDHTIYGACLAFMVPIISIFYFYSKKFNITYFHKLFLGFVLLLFLSGVYFSHSRATWISLAGCLGVLILVRFKVTFAVLMSVFALAFVFVLFNLEVIMPMLVKNKNDSKAKRANLEEQIKSVTNIKNDVSNVERVNRWLCAVRMFKERPLTGFGLGTYQFKYIPFQKESEMTTISITSPKNNLKQGLGGTAHSEYLLVLSENGIIPALLFLLIPFYIIYKGLKLVYSFQDERKYIALMMLMGLISYFIHGIFNNFLTTDKSAFLVWAGLAVLTALDYYYEKEKKEKEYGKI